jgi:ubiquinone/menaquinone biosynthesis C-methylase UbiE
MTYHWVDCDRDFITQRYDRLADVIALFDWLFFLPSGLRKHAVDRLSLQHGDCVLEVGCGTGSNFPFLREAIGATGRIYGVDLSAGMLRKARKLSDRHLWINIHLTEDDAANYVAPEPLDGVLFSLSYNTMPHHLTVLRRVWKQLRPGGRLVIMDSKLPPGLGGKLLLPFSLWMMRHTLLGNPYIRPWEHHAELVDNFEMQEFLFASYYVCCGVKPVNGVRASPQRLAPGRPRLQRRSVRSWLRPCREGLNCGDLPRSGIRSRRSRPRHSRSPSGLGEMRADDPRSCQTRWGGETPITGIADCCARAASGHAAAPPSSMMNSRRLIIRSPRRLGSTRDFTERTMRNVQQGSGISPLSRPRV